jgi:hypothetical protein
VLAAAAAHAFAELIQPYAQAMLGAAPAAAA